MDAFYHRKLCFTTTRIVRTLLHTCSYCVAHCMLLSNEYCTRSFSQLQRSVRNASTVHFLYRTSTHSRSSDYFQASLRDVGDVIWSANFSILGRSVVASFVYTLDDNLMSGKYTGRTPINAKINSRSIT